MPSGVCGATVRCRTHEGRVVGLFGPPDNFVVEAERIDVEHDRGVDVIDGDIDLDGRDPAGALAW